VSYAGGLLDFEDIWVGRFYTQESDLLTADVIQVIAYRVNDWFSVGGGPSLVFGYLKDKAAVNNVLDRFPDGQLKFEDSDVGYGGNIGILLEPRPDIRFGITYITKMDLDFKDTLELKDIGPGLTAILNRRGLFDSKVEIGLTSPPTGHGQRLL
jgi:long-chain fatty acid transport protein